MIHYFNLKLNLFSALENGLDLSRPEDYEFFMQIQPEKDHLWDMLYNLNNQLVDIQHEIGNYEYTLFQANNQFAAEDEARAQEDAERQRAWLEEARSDMYYIHELMDSLMDSETGEVATDNEQEYQELEQEHGALMLEV